MVDFVLNVPLVGQKTGYDGKPLMQPNQHGQMQPHGGMACWYAAACMVSYYFRPGPRLGLPPVWKADQGLSVSAINQLAMAEGLKAVAKPATGLTSEAVALLLKTYGPIWTAIRGHVIVLTGVKGNAILYNDPWEPRAKQCTWQWLSSNVLNLPNALLVKDRARS